ncbi:MAG: hypothetical protein ABR548_11010 [Actinomycetota bacterium]
MRAIGIDNFFEALEESRTPGELIGIPSPAAYDWSRIVAEGRAARAAADGGVWRIGQLALLVERKYRSRALQRFATDIGECYATVRRYRWVAARYDAGIRFRFPGLSFSHFQAVASLPDRVTWLGKAEKGMWSVDRLMKESRGAAVDEGSADSLKRIRSQVTGATRTLSRLRELDDAVVAAAAKEWLLEAIEEITAEAESLRARLEQLTTRRRPARRHSVAPRRLKQSTARAALR